MRKNECLRVTAVALAAAALLSGCNANNIESTSSVPARDTAGTTEESVTETTGTFNHGHSISDASADRPYEIKRSSDVLTNSHKALEYLKNCVELPGEDLEFVLTDTSEDDPGAYMWYEFTLSYKGFLVMNSEFRVITFTDGTICEGRSEVLTCTFADPDDVIDKDEALRIYANEYKDDREYKYIEDLYCFTGKGNTECKFVYKYKYDCGNLFENNTILLNAKTGEMIGCWPDAID